LPWCGAAGKRGFSRARVDLVIVGSSILGFADARSQRALGGCAGRGGEGLCPFGPLTKGGL
jgi:hypothetical protein